MQRTLRVIDLINEWIGRIAALLILPLVASIVYDVTMRYAFDAPTIWAWDLNILIQGAIVVLGGGYALLYKGHISVDVLSSRLSPRKRARLDLFTNLLFIVAISLLLWKVTQNTFHSIRILEEFTSTWGPPIYPLKVIMTIGISAMLLQAIAGWIRDFRMAFLEKGSSQ